MTDSMLHQRHSPRLRSTTLSHTSCRRPSLPFQNFDSGFPVSFVPTTIIHEGWIVNDAAVSLIGGSHSSPNNVKLQNDGGPFTNSYIRTPFLPFGVGAVQFYAKNRASSEVSIFFEIQTSSDGVNWSTYEEMTSSDRDNYVQFTSILNTNSPIYVRIFKTEATPENIELIIDTITVFFPPSTVDFGLNMIHPGYPSSSDTVRVTCFVTNTANFLPSVGISPRVYYRVRPRFGSWPGQWQGPIEMAREGNTDRFTTIADVPRTNTAYDVQYYVQATFNGYSGLQSLNHNPSYFPRGIEVTNTSFFAPPTDGFPYNVRRFRSDFGTYDVVLNGQLVSMSLLEDRRWQGVGALQNQGAMIFQFEGNGRYTNSANDYLDASYNSGDNQHYRQKLPLNSTADAGESNITLAAASGQNFSGQFLFRYDEDTKVYTVQKCMWQDFETFQPTAPYIRMFDDGLFPFQPDFDNLWDANQSFQSVQDFNTTSYPSSYAPGGAFGNSLWGIYNSRVPAGQKYAETNPDNNGGLDLRYIVRARFGSEN